MRVTLVTLLALVALVASAGSGTPEPTQVAQLVTDFGLRLFRAALAARGDTNVVFAPYGATSVLVALQVATAGRGRRQLEVATGFSIDGPGVSAELRGLRRALGGPGHTLEVAQGVFVARGVALRGGFVTRLARALGPRSLARLDLANGEGARRVLNAWARARTRGLVAGLVAPGAVAPGARLLVASAEFFGGSWAVPFPPRATRARPFLRPGDSGDSGDTAPMMEVTLRLRCGEPGDTWGHLFSLETSWDLRGPLKALGVLDLFDPERADFSPLT
ncbi:plasminogen activator inhibitor 1-like, partial [Pyrgilauda ruficollis]|uniref:plasminogen activator inhibitor 1-like n=1 Tax=Pyrgilauda ruficollis TaxID=221976 RepID=UPI001B8713E7